MLVYTLTVNEYFEWMSTLSKWVLWVSAFSWWVHWVCTLRKWIFWVREYLSEWTAYSEWLSDSILEPTVINLHNHWYFCSSLNLYSKVLTSLYSHSWWGHTLELTRLHPNMKSYFQDAGLCAFCHNFAKNTFINCYILAIPPPLKILRCYTYTKQSQLLPCIDQLKQIIPYIC